MSAANLPFPIEEYRDRARRVREEMARRDIDVLYVMSPSNLCYLTGFESIWYPPRAPLGVLVHREDERIVFLDYERHEHLVGISAHFDEAVFYRYDDAVATVAGAIQERGWASGSVGIECWTQSPGAPLRGRGGRGDLSDRCARRRRATGRSTVCAWSSRRRSSSACGGPGRSSTPPSPRCPARSARG